MSKSPYEATDHLLTNLNIFFCPFIISTFLPSAYGPMPCFVSYFSPKLSDPAQTRPSGWQTAKLGRLPSVWQLQNFLEYSRASDNTPAGTTELFPYQ